MPDFQTIREAMSRSRADATAAQNDLDVARQRRARLEAQYSRALRVRFAKADDEKLDALRKKVVESREAERAFDEKLKEVSAAGAELRKVFGDTVDPRVAINEWNGETPILLFPIRLETRFQGTETGEHELWVRLYPDECSIDNFEPTLSENEISSGTRYWVEIWAAGGIDEQSRAAWRNLVASHGSGRAAWIVREFVPRNAKPQKANASDVFLVIAKHELPSNEEQTALAAYWEAIWLAEGNREQIDAATAALAASPGVADPDQLIARFVPANLSTTPTPPQRRSDVAVQIVWLVLPEAAGLKTRSWTAPARVNTLPDCFVVLGYQNGQEVFAKQGQPIPSSLVAGPDPSAPAVEQIQHDENGNLVVPESMRWMVDFEQAVAVGMGIKVPLDPAQVNVDKPIERIIALGVRLSEDEQSSRSLLEDLLTHHRYSSDGLAFVPQGTPTNNTETQGAGYSRQDNADVAYDALFGAAAELRLTEDWWKRRDGQWLGDALGIDHRVFDRVSNASGSDFAEARALNRALWPGTAGYALETMLHPIFNSEQVDATRWFYTHFVTGRGFLPCLRIGNQPYGVLPISAVSRWKWIRGDEQIRIAGLRAPDRFSAFLGGLYSVLAAIRRDWTTLAQAVSHVGKTGDPHQLLLDILDLHPASIEFHLRYAESLDDIFNRAKLHGIGAQLLEHIRVSQLQQQAMELLGRLGYTGGLEPDALQRFFFTRASRLNGPLIDDRPLSELDPIRGYTVDNRDYITWLATVGRESFEDLRLENGFIDSRPPDALLYVMLRHALLLGFWDASLRFHQTAGVLNDEEVKGKRRESTSIHIAQEKESESRYVPLYNTDARVSGQAGQTVAARIGQALNYSPEARALADQLASLDLLKGIPTARLERCLAEHVDTLSFRLDAWILGLVHLQLSVLRYPSRPDGRFAAKNGIYLGAYGWLENLQRKDVPLEPVELEPELREVFAGDGPLYRDPANGGYIFALSLNQATTAAILRSGYLANASPQRPQTLAVNLSSARVRVALDLIEGIRNGQPLGALLGYMFQRGLHEHPAPLDKFIQPFRQHFPLVANQLASTAAPGAAIETIEANNVLDGLKLIEHVRKPGNISYPFGLPLIPATQLESAAINEEVNRLLDAQDALADLALAEGVHQAVLGNYDRVAATFDAYSKGTFPPEPEVVRTPRSGTTLTHRVGLHFEAGVDPTVSPIAGIQVSPRAQAQPMINKWLASILPDSRHVGCQVSWIDPATGAARVETVTQFDLNLQPIDLLYIVAPDGQRAMTELDDRIIRHVFEQLRRPRADGLLTLDHTARLAPPLKSFFELAAVLRHLRSLLLRSRPLVATDLALAGEANSNDNATQTISRSRVENVWNALDQLRQDLNGFDGAALTIDGAITEFVSLFERAARFGLQQVGWGSVYEWRRGQFAKLVTHIKAVIERWTQRLATFDQRYADYSNQPPEMSDEERFATLRPLELLIATDLTSPLPVNPGDYEATLLARRQRFVDKLTLLNAVITTANPNFAAFVEMVNAELPLTEFDNTPFPSAFTRSELKAKVKAIVSRWTERLVRFDEGLIAYDNPPAPRSDEERFAQLEKLDLLVAAKPLRPRPADPNIYRTALNARRTRFADKLAQLTAVLNTTDPRPERFLVALRSELPLANFDKAPLFLDKTEAEIGSMIEELHSRIGNLQVEIQKRLASATEALQKADAQSDPAARVKALQDAGSALLGEEVKLIAEFSFGPAQAAELTNAYSAHADGTLLRYLEQTRKIDFPVDDWLHGIARVREKLFAWEQMALLVNAFGRPEPALTPIQLPFHSGEGWLALEFDAGERMDGERLLYTAHYAVSPNTAASTCGVLLDEWTEVIPAETETAGLTFHYDQPNSEPPQTWLLVTPPRMGGAWQWSDLVAALEESLDLARLRAVELDQVDAETYARFLPATTSAVTLHGISISAPYARVNRVMASVEVDVDG
jgi:hypothetical protein